MEPLAARPAGCGEQCCRHGRREWTGPPRPLNPGAEASLAAVQGAPCGSGDTSEPVCLPLRAADFTHLTGPAGSEVTAARLQGTNSSRPVLCAVMLGSPLGLVIPQELENDPPAPWDLGTGPPVGKGCCRP